MRLDQMLTRQGLSQSRSRARDAILRGCVFVDGVQCKQPARNVSPSVTITVSDPASTYVSRAALKLLAGLEACSFDVAGKTCLDIGASTGGFTQVLLQRGARHVLAVDVGHGQMAAEIANDRRVTNLEGLNARELAQSDLGDLPVEFIVCDVSFISIKLALPPALALARSGAGGIFLIKPQFEAGRQHVGKGGLLRDRDQAIVIAEQLRDWLDQQPDWRSTHLAASPISGGDGNQEYLLCARKINDG